MSSNGTARCAGASTADRAACRNPCLRQAHHHPIAGLDHSIIIDGLAGKSAQSRAQPLERGAVANGGARRGTRHGAPSRYFDSR